MDIGGLIVLGIGVVLGYLLVKWIEKFQDTNSIKEGNLSDENIIAKIKNLSRTNKKNILSLIRVLLAFNIIGILFFITPHINENIKIILSFLITLGAFISTFTIKEKSGYSTLTRGLIFIGQEFFGITMLLMMVNKGMNYSINTILVIWTIFNLYISKQFEKIENKLFCAGTLIALVMSSLDMYAEDIDTLFFLGGLCLISIAIQFFSKKQDLLIKFIHNVTVTLLIMMSIGTLFETENLVLGFFIILVYMVVNLILTIIKKEFNVKALAVYIPFIVSLALNEVEFEGFLEFLSLGNILFAIMVISNKSIYKKLLCGGILLLTIPHLVDSCIVDETVALVVYGSAVLISLTYIFSASKKKAIKEGGEGNEEQNN